MVFNQTVELDSNGDPLSSVISDTQVKTYVSEFVSQKSSLESLINSSYQIIVDLSVMNLEGIRFYFNLI